MKDNIAKAAGRIIDKYRLKKIDYDVLEKVASDMGYDTVEYFRAGNSADAETVITRLGLSELTEKSRGFTYADDRYRIIFICGELSREEKLLVMAHELGHIALGHVAGENILGRDVKEEYEANEFAHYILNRGKGDRCKSFVKRHKGGSIAALLLVAAVIAAFAIIWGTENEKSYCDNYYVTSSGNRYHEEECIFVKNKKTVRRLKIKEFESGEYERCNICLP